MNNNKNIIFNHTLEQYNKKYRNRRYRLIKYTKKQVEDFDKQYGHYSYNGKTHSLEFNNYLLKDRKWWFTKEDECYHEIPRPVRFTWFRNLNAGVQVATCVLGAGIVATAVAVPTILLSSDQIIFDTNNKDVELVKVEKDKDTNDTVITLKSKKDDVSIVSVEVKKGTEVLKEHTDYSYNDATLEVRIHEDAMAKPGKITITPKITEDIQHVEQQTWIQAYTPYSKKFEQYCSGSLHYNIEDLEISGLFIDESGKKFVTKPHPFPIQYKTETYTLETNATIEVNSFHVDFTKGTDSKMYNKRLGGGVFDYRVIQKQVFEKEYEVECDFDYIINKKEKYVKYDMYEKGTKKLYNSVKFNANGFIENTYSNINLGSQLLIKYKDNPKREEHVQQYAMAGAAGYIQDGSQTGAANYKFSVSSINLKKDCDYKFYLRTGIYDRVNMSSKVIGSCKCGFVQFVFDQDVSQKISQDSLKISITGYEDLDATINGTKIYATKDSAIVQVNEVEKDVYLSFKMTDDASNIKITAQGLAYPIE